MRRFFRESFRCFFIPALLVVLSAAASGEEAILLDVSLPITGKSSHAIAWALERSVQEIRRADRSETEPEPQDEDTLRSMPTVVIRFKVGADQEAFGRGSSFGACYELAGLLSGEKFNGIRTVAYFPQSVRGHALLVALACDERIAASDTEIGQAEIDETSLSETQRQAYHEISNRRRALPSAVVDKLVDPDIELLEVETEKGIRLVSPKEIEELRKTETFAGEPQTVIPAGSPGLFSADLARKIGLVNLIADDRIALARGLGFRPDDFRSAPVAGELGHAVRINISGIITADNTGTAIRSIQAALEPPAQVNARKIGTVQVDFLCICIDSPGGNLEASLNLAAYIAGNVDSTQVRTVAYIPHRALSDSALIALACDEIVLGPDAQLGGDGAKEFSADQIVDARRMIREFLSKEALRSWSMPVAFVDRDIEVFKTTRQGRPPLVDYFCEEEFKDLPDADFWEKGDIVKPKGKLLQIVGGKGEQYLVDRSAKDFAEFKHLYGLENDPLLVEPGWADQLVRALSSPGMSAFILMVVILAVIIESNTPGIGVGAFIAVMGIFLFFWLNFLGGTAGWLEITLFVVGVCCVLLEIFVLPGVGIFGIGGALAIIVSLVLASQTFIIPQNSYQLNQLQSSLMILLISGIGVLVLGILLSRAVHKANKPKDTSLIRETEKLASYEHLIGQTGVTTTPLVPAGKALFNGQPVDIVSDGEMIEKGVRVEVVEVVGYKVVVRSEAR